MMAVSQRKRLYSGVSLYGIVRGFVFEIEVVRRESRIGSEYC
jgi:hypothetical protein